MKRILHGLLLVIFPLGSSHAAERGWSRLTGCRLMENSANDGDSFHVEYKGREYIFRLYFVDACESSEQIPERVKEQAKFLKIAPSRVLEAGLAAEKFTRGLLEGRTFTIVTKWEDARGASRLPRNYAFVLFGANDESDLASTLAQNGFVRIYGMPADPPGPVTDAQYHASLLKLDARARARRLGIFGNLAGSASTAASGVTGDASPGAGASSGSRPVSAAPILLPRSYHAPDVIDDPADSALDEFAIQVGESLAPAVNTEITIPEDNFSEIPGWKPKPKSTPASEPPETE